ncbi:M56 family metallopeptidase [Flavobacterium frigoris]|uniref:TonB protein C-terminal n=1 Tax=Flavobacterium frigoris TaxID=229204 RepID=A0A1H9PGA5_FLAFI|nr:M56 family metallopeptidase [Flavobacterium frigoris]SER47326.1 TonB protein C-terminal [Flavobacterium frigoris]
MQDATNYWLLSIWSIYALVTAILLFRFARNIIKLNTKTKSNTAIDYKNSKLVLLKEETLPYTFLNTIFINEAAYYNRKIEKELYTHELIHVTQRHTLDVLVIETLKALFWFNPIFIFYKKAIQLNHEFLADEKVVKAHHNIPFYQNLLISKANANPTYYLASNLNYSVTKKRLIMMTKTTSISRALLKKGLIIPLLTVLLFSLCTKVVAQEQKVVKAEQTKNQLTGVEKYFENTIFKIRDEKGKIVAEKRFSELSNQEKKNVPPPPPPVAKQATSEQSANLKEAEGPKWVELSAYDKEDNKAYKVADTETQPTFPGGMNEFYKFVAANFKVSKEATANKIKGKVYVTFMVEKDGSLSEFTILRDMGYGTGEETIRVLKLSPNWTPGTVDGEVARVMYSLPITIQSTP